MFNPRKELNLSGNRTFHKPENVPTIFFVPKTNVDRLVGLRCTQNKNECACPNSFSLNFRVTSPSNCKNEKDGDC